MTPIKVLLCDYQLLTREGISKVIDKQADMELVEVVDDHALILDPILKHHPNVLVLDYEEYDPILTTVLKNILENGLTNVLLITNDEEPFQIQRLLDLGLKGIVTKFCSEREIVNAIHAVANKNRFFCNRILDVVLDSETDPEEKKLEPDELSSREFEVLQLIAKGHKTAEIADQLNLSVHTINSHRKNILKKLNLKSPTELIVYAIENGWIRA
jgi:DNA-binding NarL/FixJ family response regulator